MASYSAQVSTIHKEFKASLKQATTKKEVDEAYRTHKKQHQDLLKEHLQEEMAMVKTVKGKMK
jgi:hypothetical protein